MIEVNKQILGFRKFLLDSWNDLDQLMHNHNWHDDIDFIDEWLQVNWEFLVERQLLKKTGFLNPYGMFYKNPRVTHSSGKITHVIICKPKSDHVLIDDMTQTILPENRVLVFHCFYKKNINNYGLYPPFDSVGLISDDQKIKYHVVLNSVDFFLCPIKDFKREYPNAWFLREESFAKGC